MVHNPHSEGALKEQRLACPQVALPPFPAPAPALLQWSAGGSALPATCVRDAALCALLLLAWRLRQLDQEFPDPAALADLAAKRAAFVDSLEGIATDAAGAEGGSAELRDEVRRRSQLLVMLGAPEPLFACRGG